MLLEFALVRVNVKLININLCRTSQRILQYIKAFKQFNCKYYYRQRQRQRTTHVDGTTAIVKKRQCDPVGAISRIGRPINPCTIRSNTLFCIWRDQLKSVNTGITIRIIKKVAISSEDQILPRWSLSIN